MIIFVDAVMLKTTMKIVYLISINVNIIHDFNNKLIYLLLSIKEIEIVIHPFLNKIYLFYQFISIVCDMTFIFYLMQLSLILYFSIIIHISIIIIIYCGLSES